jgi:hypothetical protein
MRFGISTGLRGLSTTRLRLRIWLEEPTRVTAYHALLVVELWLATVPIDYICQMVELSRNKVERLLKGVRNRLIFPQTRLTKHDVKWLRKRANWMDQIRFNEAVDTSTWSNSEIYYSNMYRSYLGTKHENINKPISLAAEGFYWANRDAHRDAKLTAERFNLPETDIEKYIQRAEFIYLNLRDDRLTWIL